MEKILIVEDDKKLREELKIFLNNSGYEAYVLESFSNTINDIIDINPDLLLLDINLPNIDGQYICKELRKVSDISIIIITSRDSELDELISLNYGADYYVTKPFNIRILLAKIEALLRRSKRNEYSQDKINCGEFILNMSKSLIEKEGKFIELTKNEFRILKLLCQNREKIVSRDNIIEYLWDNESFIDDNTLTVNINRLRSKLESIGLSDVIVTKRGQGYIILWD